MRPGTGGWFRAAVTASWWSRSDPATEGTTWLIIEYMDLDQKTDHEPSTSAAFVGLADMPKDPIPRDSGVYVVVRST